MIFLNELKCCEIDYDKSLRSLDLRPVKELLLL